MSPLKDAGMAIETEIASIESRLFLLKGALAQLVEAIPKSNNASIKSDNLSGSFTNLKSSIPKVSRKQSTELPKTGEGFWLGFIDSKPKLSVDIFLSALSALSIQPNSADAKILRQRLSVALSIMSKKKGLLSFTGEGRLRKYAKV